MTQSKAKIVREFCEHSTIHGLSFSVRQEQGSLKAFWIVIIAGALAVMSIHLYSIISAYLQYKSSETAYELRNGYKFPDITICNLNGISASNLKSVAKTNPDLNAYYQRLFSTNASLRTEMPVSPGTLFWALGEDAREVGHSFDDMILGCRFEESDCKEDDFILFPFPSFFNCFTFVRGRKEKLITTNGLRAALSITMYLEPENPGISQSYSNKPHFANNVGVRILITPPNYLAAIGNYGHEFSPGLTTSIGFDITKHIRLSEPYSTCRSTESMKLEGDVEYSYVECRNMCVQDIVIEQCGCYATRYITRRNKTVPSCGHYVLSNKTKADEMLKCLARATDGVQTKYNFGDRCNCHWPCEDTTYSLTMSHSQWPSKKSLDSFIDKVLAKHPKSENLKAYQYYKKLKSLNATKDEIHEWVSSHFLRLNIYANSNIVSVKQQIPMYTQTDLLCNVGGCLGLWVGMSIITIVEFFDVGFKLLAKFLSAENERVLK